MQGIILAGGRGTRLAPYTTIFPKPLLPIGDVPILDVVIRQLARHGVQQLTFAVGHLAELLMAYFADGSKYGVQLSYAREVEPLGTAGPLGSIPGLNETFLVMNGDILTTLDYARLIAAHRQSGAIATIAAHRRNVYIDFGVIEARDGLEVAAYHEKPTQQYLVSMGIYIFEPEILRFIQPGKKLDFPDLVQRLLQAKVKVALYPSEDFWLDIGRPDDYHKAIEVFAQQPDMFLGEPPLPETRSQE
jgi:NDP-sugar pyrophosphorylase family protein